MPTPDDRNSPDGSDWTALLPEHGRRWAEDHRDVRERVASEATATGRWPPVKPLARTLAQEGRPLPLRNLLRDMPKRLGFVEQQPDRIVLLCVRTRFDRGRRPRC